jgi:hypothetical protein
MRAETPVGAVMKRVRFVIILSILVLSACNDHLRDGQFDLGDEDFTILPPCDLFIYEVYYDPGTGLINGICFAVGFEDSLVRDFYLVHTLECNDEQVWRYGLGIEPGYEFYGFILRYGDNRPWPTGLYWHDIHWGEICVAACAFEIVVENDRMVVKENHDLRLMNKVEMDSHLIIDN